MSVNPDIAGIHHITAVTSSAANNLAFYEKILGLRLVKKTVNFDDPYTYHLYYGNTQGSPGTLVTFFPWENLLQGKPGAGMVTAIAFAIPRPSMDFWAQRITATGTAIQTGERFGDPVIQFHDPCGLPIELIGIPDPPSTGPPYQSPIPASCAITGFHSATATLSALDDIRSLLVDVMGMDLHHHEANRYRFMMKDRGSPGHWYDVLVDTHAALGKPGGGTVHHIAFRTASDRTQALWQKHLRKNGVPATDVRDRKYFRSIYFNSPEGILFEIATDPPGFAIDESMDALGTALKLPDQYEPIRAAIENRLPPLHSTSFHHVFKDAPKPADDGRTVVTLHGTGGNEHDLVRFAEGLAATSAILSPRGRILENGMPRFFKRLSDNVFDEADVIQRAHELSDFLMEAAVRYGRKPAQMTALGYSNGANMAAAILLLRPEVFSSAVLLRPMLPLQKQSLPDLKGKAILILKGAQDAIIPSDSTDQLVSSLQQAGAEVITRTIAAGHEIKRQDIDTISDWLSERPEINGNHLHAASMPTIDDPRRVAP